MPINNSYSQTPKRIFTNKPFIKGMNYTNADLEPFVCRAVSNLELESSNSATKLRYGIYNKAIGNEGEIAYKFYNKYIMFKNITNEMLYNNNLLLNTYFSGFGIRVLNNNYKEIPIYDKIITNNTELAYNDELIISGGESGISITDSLQIIALQMNEGDIPHCINDEDFSFVFLGFIISNDNILYKGFIKLYHHKIANKIIIEIIKPEQVNNTDISDYGLNLLSNSPSVYKDYIPFIEHDFYNDYMGVDKSKEAKNTIDLLTVALYDNPVNPAPFVNTTTAKMLKGVNSTNPTQSVVYLRPYYVMSYGHYGAIIKASNKTGSEVYYNFDNNTFGLSSNVTKVVNETKTINMSTYVNGRQSNDREYTGVLDESQVTITKCIIPSFKLLGYGTDMTEYNALPPSEELSTSPRVYNMGFVKQTYKMYINKYSIPAYINETVLNNSITSNNTNISPTSRTELVLDKYKNSSIYLNIQDTCNQYFRCTNNNGLIVTTNSQTVKSYYEFETEYSEYGSGGVYRYPIKNVMHTHFENTVYVYDRLVSQYTPSVGVSSPSTLSMNIQGAFSLTRSSSGAHVSITTHDEPDIEFSSNNIMHCKSYTIRVDIDYEYNSFEFGLVDRLLNDSDSLHVVNNASDVGTTEDYVFAQKACDLGDEVATDSYVITRSFLEDGILDLPTIAITFNVRAEESYSHQTNISTSNNYTGAIPQSIDFNTVINIDYLNTINDNDTSMGYSINQEINCRQSDIQYITDSIYVRHNGTTIYDYNTDFASLTTSDVLNLFEQGSVNSNAKVPIELYTSKESAHISKNYVHIVQDVNNNREFSIPIASSAFNSIMGSSIVVRLFPIINVHTDSADNSKYIEYKESYVVEQPLYSIRTDLDSSVDMSEIINDKFKTTALRMCNHLGHTVVWGDETNTNSLYYSAYGNISYFPSNYVITFNNPIVYAYPHKGNLVVFTTDDIYLLYNGNVPSTTSNDGTEVAFSQKLIQANTRLGKEHINTVRTVGKDIFFINNNNNGYLLKSNKYVNDESDVYLVKLTTQINDLLDNPYEFALERFNKWDVSSLDTHNIIPEASHLPIYLVVLDSLYDDAFINNVYNLDMHLDDSNNLKIIDGDTISIDGISYRLADIDTPEITNGKNERLGNLAKDVLSYLIHNTGVKLRILDTGDIDEYERHIAYIILQTSEELDESDFININATMLYNGLANFFDENHDKSQQLLPLSQKSYIYAKSQKLGVYNDKDYSNVEFTVIDYESYPANFVDFTRYWLKNNNQIYAYANNSYIYIFQSVHLDYLKSITLIYKYNIDSKIYTMYDIIGYINPTDIISDNSMVGFSILNMNDSDRYLPSILSFTSNKIDINEVGYNTNTDEVPGDYNLCITHNEFIINAYFDSGNQSISLMNDKLFREIKLSLGSLPDSLLSMDYQIDLYVDGKLVIPNQQGSCKEHIHHVPINTHYKGSVENVSGFQKVTFFAPARGRIPRIVFSINCKTDINILEYAIVYMQLNAK